MINIYIPNNINFLLLKNNYIYIYNNSYFFCTQVLNYIFFYNKYLNILKIKNNTTTHNIHFKNLNYLNNFLFSWNYFFFSKIYFLGKGFKIKKINKNIIFNFNHAHINIILNLFTVIKKIQKTKLLIFSKNLNKLKLLNKIIINIKKINPYTKRGLRLTKQIIYKKRNKSNIQN